MTVAGPGFESVVGSTSRHAPDELLLGFARALRAAGVPVTHDRSATFLDAVSRVGIDDPRGVYWAGRATLCSSPDDVARFDDVYDAWFLAGEGLPRTVQRQRSQPRSAPLPTEEGGLGRHRTVLIAADGNAASQAVAERIGFSRNGIEHQAETLGDGSTVDLVRFELLESDWRS